MNKHFAAKVCGIQDRSWFPSPRVIVFSHQLSPIDSGVQDITMMMGLIGLFWYFLCDG
jgi:hypothetical protein